MSENTNAETNQEEKDTNVDPPVKDVEETDADEKDVQENKAMGILAYIIFFIPLLAAKESKFAMYHANQGLSLFLVGVGVNVVGYILPIIGWLIILPLGYLALIALAIIGIINASGGKMKPLPVIGSWKLIK